MYSGGAQNILEASGYKTQSTKGKHTVRYNEICHLPHTTAVPTLTQVYHHTLIVNTQLHLHFIA